MTYTRDDVAPFRCVDGKNVALTDAQRDAIAAEWNAEAARQVIREADAVRGAEIDQDIAAQTIGNVTPKTVAQLKAMTKDEFFTWFDANVPVTAAAIYALVRRLTLIIVRRVL